MLEWNDLHPYNAVHVVRVREVLDRPRLEAAIARTLERRGLMGLVLDRHARTYQYQGGPASVELRVCDAGPGWSPAFAQEIERELNQPFAHAGSCNPFRCVVLPEGDAFSLALAYFHPVADAHSIVFLLKDIVDEYRGGADAAPEAVPRSDPGCGDSLLRSHPSVVARKLASLPASVAQMRHSCRPNYRDPADFHNGLTLFTLGAEALRRVVRTAKALEVTVNDLFLALLMQAVSQIAPKRTRADRRRNLTLGCIVNTRKDLGRDSGGDFGLHLGSFFVHHEAPAGIALADLARDIGGQTRRIKQSRLYLGAGVELTLGRLLMSLFAEHRRKKLYQKHYPLWGGLTNMNLNALWPQPEGARAVDYVRAVSTGPVTPLVVSVTTIGAVANVTVTYRSTVFGAPEIERLKACFLEPAGLLATA